MTTPKVLEKLDRFKHELRPFNVVTVPFPKKEVGLLWKGYFIMPYTEKFDDLHGRPMVNAVSGETFYIHDKNSSTQPKPSGWLSLKTMEEEIENILSRSESKFCTPNGGTCTSKTIGLLVRRHIRAGEFHRVGKEASTRWASGPELSMLDDAGMLDPTHETFREYERVVDENIWIKSGKRQNNFPLSFYPAKRELPSAQSGILRMVKTRSGLATSEN